MGRAKREPKTTITRRVFFYRVNAGVHADTGQPKSLNFQPIVRQLNALPFTSAGRYLTSEQDKELCCWSDSTMYPYRVKLGYIRRGQYPPLEDSGSLTPLVLKEGQGLAEITHLVLFDDGICGAEFNRFAPRASQLPYYLSRKLESSCPGFRLANLLRSDLEPRLAAISDIKLLDLKVRASFNSILQEANEDLGAALAANIKAVNARPEDEIQFIFKRKKNRNLESRSVPALLIDAIRNLARRPELREQASIFKVDSGSGSNSELLDILREQFAERKEVMPASDSVGGVDSNSMFDAIENAYNELKDQLSSASEVE